MVHAIFFWDIVGTLGLGRGGGRSLVSTGGHLKCQNGATQVRKKYELANCFRVPSQRFAQSSTRRFRC
eukprot:5934117-Amphidinium_carterae.1